MEECVKAVLRMAQLIQGSYGEEPIALEKALGTHCLVCEQCFIELRAWGEMIDDGFPRHEATDAMFLATYRSERTMRGKEFADKLEAGFRQLRSENKRN